jgi:hypothetical protein
VSSENCGTHSDLLEGRLGIFIAFESGRECWLACSAREGNNWARRKSISVRSSGLCRTGPRDIWPNSVIRHKHGVVRLEGQIAALTTDPSFADGDYKAQPKKGLEAFGLVWAGWLFSQEWWRRELWREEGKRGTTFEQVLNSFRTNFIPGADANDLILQMRTWEKHDIGATAGFGGDVEGPLNQLRFRFCTCHRKRTYIFRLETYDMRRRSFPACR